MFGWNFVILSGFLVFFVNTVGAVELKKIPTVAPNGTLKVGERVGLTVRVKNPESLTDILRFNYGRHSAYLEWDEKKKALVGEFEVPKYERETEPTMGFELYGKGGQTFLYGISEEYAKQLLKNLASNRENLSMGYFPRPSFEAPIVDKEPPTLSNVKVTKLAKNRIRVEFEQEDPSGIYFTYIQISGEFNADKAPTRLYINSGLQVPCEGTPEKVKCSVETALPEEIPGTPTLSINVWDESGNQKRYSSEKGDFAFEWPNRKPTAYDVAIPKLDKVQFVRQEGNKITLRLEYSQVDRIIEIIPMVTRLNEKGEASSGAGYQDKDILLVPQGIGTMEVTFALPKKQPEEKNFTIGLHFKGDNGNSDSELLLPEDVRKKMDLSLIPKDLTKEQGVPEVLSIEFSKL